VTDERKGKGGRKNIQLAGFLANAAQQGGKGGKCEAIDEGETYRETRRGEERGDLIRRRFEKVGPVWTEFISLHKGTNLKKKVTETGKRNDASIGTGEKRIDRNLCCCIGLVKTVMGKSKKWRYSSLKINQENQDSDGFHPVQKAGGRVYWKHKRNEGRLLY